MLPIQEFMRDNHTLEDLFQQYDINYNSVPELGVAVLNYRLLSTLSDPIVAQSRGLVLELDTWNVVYKSIDAFHEPDSPLGAEVLKNFDWSTAKALPKYDGALLGFYYYKDAWRVCTRYSADGSWAVWSITSEPQTITWAELTKLTIEDMGYTWDSFTSQLDKSIYYTFELCAPENRIIVVYPDRKLHLVAAVDSKTLQEIDIYTLDFPVDKPSFTSVHSLQKVEALIEANPAPYETEGFVVVNDKFERLKVRNAQFVNLMRAKTATDDISMLKEIRMMDLGSGYGTGTGTGTGTHTITVVSIQSGVIGFSVLEVGSQTSVGKITRATLAGASMMTRVMTMCRYMRDVYHAQKANALADEELKFAQHVWPDALRMMQEGMSMTEILDITSETNLRDALIRFETA